MASRDQQLYVCNQCRDAGEDFAVPADIFGVEFMKEHLREKHPHRPEPKEIKS